MVASWAACLNRKKGTPHRLNRAHFDNTERPAGGDLSIYCDVGFGFRLSARSQCVLDPWSAVGNGLAGKAWVRWDNLQQFHNPMNAALAKGESGA